LRELWRKRNGSSRLVDARVFAYQTETFGSCSVADNRRKIPGLVDSKELDDHETVASAIAAGRTQARTRSDFAGDTMRRTSMRSARRALARATKN
jgi:hypothetical protein